MLKTSIMDRFGLAQPVIQAPMAGGGDTPALVAQVGNAGGLGFIGAAYLTPGQIADAAKAIRAQSSHPFGINLFIPDSEPASTAGMAATLARIAPYFAELGLPAPQAPTGRIVDFEAQLDAVLESGAAALSFTFGILPAAALAAAKARGLMVLGTATTVREAEALVAIGVDGIVAQGAEAGGHRGTFARDAEPALIGTMALVPQIVDRVRLPVIAAGGIMDGRGIVAALSLGAQAVQLGTAFLACNESGIPAAYRATLLAASEEETDVTRAFSGRAARGIVNRFMREWGAPLPFPLQNELTRPLRSAAAKAGRAEFLSLWAGQGVRMARADAAAELMRRLNEETEAALRMLGVQNPA